MGPPSRMPREHPEASSHGREWWWVVAAAAPVKTPGWRSSPQGEICGFAPGRAGRRGRGETGVSEERFSFWKPEFGKKPTGHNYYLKNDPPSPNKALRLLLVLPRFPPLSSICSQPLDAAPPPPRNPVSVYWPVCGLHAQSRSRI